MNTAFALRRLAWASVLSMVGLAGACSDGQVGDEKTGSARLAVTSVPDDVNCIRINAVGSTTVQTLVTVTPGQPVSFDLDGQPIGVVAFSADAFLSICAAVTQSTVPTWVSNTVTVTLSAGVQAQIALTLHENGLAAVDLDFVSGLGCHSATQPCLADTDCCSGFCYPNNTCAGACAPNNAPCSQAADCCAGQCSNNTCCVPQGNDCNTDSDCCSSNCNGGVCGGGGGCMFASQCPGQDTECQQRTCNGGVCGFVFAPAGTFVSGQVAGDCAALVCDGNGSIVAIPDNIDVADDGNECTVDVCNAGVTQHSPSATGTPCNQGGGAVCDGNGSCVECVFSSDCPSNVCQGGTCAQPSCADAVKNGTETDVDCGGGQCADCVDGEQCATNSDCQSNNCNGNVCVASLSPNGAACAVSSGCLSGFCVDGLCCNTSCSGLCQACSAVKKSSGANGTCGSIAAATDPDSECPGAMSCNGAGSCF